MGLKSKSRGNGIHRFLTVYKSEGSTILSEASISFCETSKQKAISLLNKNGLTTKERQDLLPPTERERSQFGVNEGS